MDAFDGAKMRQGLAITGTASHFSASRPGSRSDARPQSSRGFRSRPQSSVKDAYKRTLVKNVLDNLVGQVEERAEASLLRPTGASGEREADSSGTVKQVKRHT